MTDGVIPLDEANRRLADEREPPIASADDYGAVSPAPGQGRQDEGALVPAPGRRPAVPTGPRIEILNPLTWQGQTVPERRWLVPDLIPLRNVTMLSGDGGVGKSTIVLQLMVACALGRQWLGKQTRPCKVFGLLCEDDEDELHRRLADICRAYDAGLGDLQNLRVCSRVGLENVWMEWKSPWEIGETTWIHAEVMNHALDFGAELVVGDSLHDIFGGEENRRVHARQFIQGSREIAREIEGAVVITAHPSLTGRNTGTGEAGSTAWNNAVRSRLYLTEVNEQTDGAEFILKSMKANYGPRGGETRLRWADGAYREITEEPGMLGAIKRGSAETAFLECLDHMRTEGREVSDRSRASNFAPRVFGERPEATGYDRKTLERAMERLFSRKIICLDTYGDRPSRQFTRIIRDDPDTKAKPLGQDGGT